MSEKRPWWRRTLPWVAAVTVVFVVVGHVGLWLSDAPFEMKRRLTLLNAAGWAAVILPAVGVSFWLKAKTRDMGTD
ncbi:MAG: phenylalanyl-tRNA synthetase subunit beta [Pseudomonadota bacterium]